MDIWSKKKRSAVMAKIRSKDTKPNGLCVVICSPVVIVTVKM